MSLVALVSAKGSPGVTTAALAMAGVWPPERRVLVAELDPAGGDLGPRFALPADPGLVQLGSVCRRGLTPADVWRHTQSLPGTTPVLLGASSPEQALGLRDLWARLGPVLANLGDDVDVLADCGRISPTSPVLEVARRADLVVAVARPTLDGVAHVRTRLAAPLTQGRFAVVLVGEAPYPTPEVEEALGARVLGVLAHDPLAASLLAGRAGNERALRRSALVRSARDLAARIAGPGTEDRSASRAARPLIETGPAALNGAATAQAQP